MRFSRHPKEKLLPILVSRTAVFFFLMCLLTLFLYAAGTVQGFIDSTMFALLRLYIVLGIFLAAASIAGVALNAIRFIKLKRERHFFRHILRISGYMLLALFAAATVMVALFIITLSKGTAA